MEKENKYGLTRPYKNLSYKELEHMLGEQLTAGKEQRMPPKKEKKVDATVFGDTTGTYLVGYDPSGYNASTSNNIYYTSTSNVTTGQIVAPYLSDPLNKRREGAAREETNREWLNRRVEEVLWHPA